MKEIDWPSGYYALRRRIETEIHLKLAHMEKKVRAAGYTDREEFYTELKIFARELSLSSGVPLKGILKMLKQNGIVLEMRELPPEVER